MKVTATPFGSHQDKTVSMFTLTNDSGMTVEILELGGIIRSLSVPDKNGEPHSCVVPGLHVGGGLPNCLRRVSMRPKM